MTSNAMKAEMLENRKCMIKIIECIQYLARQGIPLQGSTECESNLIHLLCLRSKDDKTLKKWLAQKSDKYVSHDIQNELLRIMSQSVIRDLVEEMRGGQCNYFSVISDEYTDISNKEQLTILIIT